MTRPRLIPDPADAHEDFERYQHRDIQDKSLEFLQAELWVVNEGWARRVFDGRDRGFGFVDDQQTEVSWLRDRRQRIETELKRRR